VSTPGVVAGAVGGVVVVVVVVAEVAVEEGLRWGMLAAAVEDLRWDMEGAAMRACRDRRPRGRMSIDLQWVMPRPTWGRARMWPRDLGGVALVLPGADVQI
jgi:hypothetical protein